MSAARTDWKSLPLEEKPLKERKPKPPSDVGFTGVAESRNPSLPLMREVARRAGGRDFAASFYLRCGNPETGSLPQSAALTLSLSEGAEGGDNR